MAGGTVDMAAGFNKIKVLWSKLGTGVQSFKVDVGMVEMVGRIPDLIIGSSIYRKANDS